MKYHNEDIVLFQGKETLENSIDASYEKIFLEIQEEKSHLSLMIKSQEQLLKSLERESEKIHTVVIKFLNAFDHLRDFDEKVVQSVNNSHENFLRILKSDMQEEFKKTILCQLEREIEPVKSLLKKSANKNQKRFIIYALTFFMGVLTTGFGFYYYLERKIEFYTSPHFHKKYLLGEALFKNWGALTEKEKALLVRRMR